MGKIESIGDDWDAVVMLHSVLEEVEPEDQVFVVVNTKNRGRTTYTANMVHSDLYWEAGAIQAEIMRKLTEKNGE